MREPVDEHHGFGHRISTMQALDLLVQEQHHNTTNADTANTMIDREDDGRVT